MHRFQKIKWKQKIKPQMIRLKGWNKTVYFFFSLLLVFILSERQACAFKAHDCLLSGYLVLQTCLAHQESQHGRGFELFFYTYFIDSQIPQSSCVHMMRKCKLLLFIIHTFFFLSNVFFLITVLNPISERVLQFTSPGVK